ncbi:MAG TPA: hypothetical protein VFA75_07130 [Nevskia sp.]|nr:hypothetical protein [Nevskia sp.]
MTALLALAFLAAIPALVAVAVLVGLMLAGAVYYVVLAQLAGMLVARLGGRRGLS